MKLPFLFIKTIISSFLLVIFFTACEKEADIKNFPEIQPKLVVECFLSPKDEIISLGLTRSNPTGQKKQYREFETVKDATVTISSEGNSVKLFYNIVTDQYIAYTKDFPIVPGKKYFLNISAPTGETVTAECVVPNSTVPKMRYETDVVPADYRQRMNINIYWTDIPGESNYYRLAGKASTKQTDSTVKGPHNYYSYSSETTLWFDGTNAIISDNLNDGKELGPFKTFHDFQTNDFSQVYLYLLNVDEHYAKYYLNKDNVDMTTNNPFTEPINHYSNIKGGLGLFAAYVKDSVYFTHD